MNQTPIIQSSPLIRLIEKKILYVNMENATKGKDL